MPCSQPAENNMSPTDEDSSRHVCANKTDHCDRALPVNNFAPKHKLAHCY